MSHHPQRKKILFICKKGFTYGYAGCVITKKSGLFNSAKFVADAIGGKFVEVVDNNDIDREVTDFRPDIVVIEALWVVPEKFPILQKLHPDVAWYVRLHSDIPFLAYEGIAMEWIQKYFENDVHVMTNSKNVRDALVFSFGKPVVYLPNYYPPEKPLHTGSNDPSQIHVGCFGAIRPLKNQLAQAMAAIEFAKVQKKELRFHINAARVETNGDPVLKNLRSLLGDKLVEHMWLDRNLFRETLGSLDIGLQVSMTETFNIVTADMVSVGLPVVGSKEIPWLSKASQAEINSVVDMVRKMDKVLESTWIARRNRKMLDEYSAQSLSMWFEFIEC